MLSHTQLFANSRTEACQASLTFTISPCLLKFKSTESVMPSNHLILCHSLLPISVYSSDLLPKKERCKLLYLTACRTCNRAFPKAPQMQHAQKSTVRIKFFKTLKQSKVYSKQTSTKKKKKKKQVTLKQ